MTAQDRWDEIDIWLSQSQIGFEKAYQTACDALATTRVESVAAQLPYLLTARKVFRKLRADLDSQNPARKELADVG
jgi:hypothetical protein